MSDLWIPENPIIAQLTMKIEATKFERTQVEAEAGKIMSKIDRVRSLMYQVESNLEFLGSDRAKIVLLLEYRVQKRNLNALRSEEASLLNALVRCEHNYDRLTDQINNLQAEAELSVGKVIRFRKRDEESERPKT